MKASGRTDLRLLAALTSTLVFWGSAFPFIRLALHSYSPGHLTLLRFLVASAATVFIVLALRVRIPTLRWWPALAGLSLLNVIGYHVLLNFGLVSVEAGPGSFIVNTAPVFAYLAAWPLLGERVDVRGWAGLALSIAGVSVIAFGSGSSLRWSSGVPLLLGCAVTWGVSTVAVKPLLRRLTALQVSAMTLWFGTLGLLVFLPGFVQTVRSAPPEATWSIVYLGVFPIAVSYATWNYVVSRMPATRAVNYTYLIPLIAVAEAYIMLGEKPHWTALIGGLIAMAGVVLANAARNNGPQVPDRR